MFSVHNRTDHVHCSFGFFVFITENSSTHPELSSKTIQNGPGWRMITEDRVYYGVPHGIMMSASLHAGDVKSLGCFTEGEEALLMEEPGVHSWQVKVLINKQKDQFIRERR